MITDAILSFFTSLSSGILSPLIVVDVAVDLLTSIPVVTKFIMFVAYVIPWSNLVPLFVIIMAFLFLRIMIALINFILGFVPFFGK